MKLDGQWVLTVMKSRWRDLSPIQFHCNCSYSLITHNKTPVHSTWGLLRVCAACPTVRLNLSYKLCPSWEQHPRYVSHRVHNRYRIMVDRVALGIFFGGCSLVFFLQKWSGLHSFIHSFIYSFILIHSKDTSQHVKCWKSYAVIYGLALLKMGIMIPETCWANGLLINHNCCIKLVSHVISFIHSFTHHQCCNILANDGLVK